MGKQDTTAPALGSKRAIIAYLDAACEAGEPEKIAEALGTVMRSVGMAKVARETGLGRENLYISFSASGNPRLSTLTAVLGVLGLRLALKPTTTEP
ncbi:addiction module antidote protein [Xanthomonas perforans]|uniref:addiction module antidote protein n=1 Tax=Xanthomonas perforans TaxID=442694 RepID=UPI002358DEDD|nr:addiction module antidote protein [Xanthomonas perforans]MDC9654389.1 putative addiction module antidote protein [Xanthomonas perforans]MEB2159628.1 addiction module antidote protein [Xanthomonas campestris pv. campestris]